LTPSQQAILDEALSVGWNAQDRSRLEILLMTRNVFHGRTARKLTKHLREVVKEDKLSERDEILEKIRKILPEEKKPVKIISVNPIFGFARDNK
jgi:hypothetical protein